MQNLQVYTNNHQTPKCANLKFENKLGKKNVNLEWQVFYNM